MLEKIRLQEEMELWVQTNAKSEKVTIIEENIPINYIQFHFCQQGKGVYTFNTNYHLSITPQQALLLYNPQKELPLQLTLDTNTTIITLLISIRYCHSLFSDTSDSISFLENQDKKYYHTQAITPTMDITLQQLVQCTMHKSVLPLYYKAKSYELLSLFFNRPDDDSAQEKCPFLADEENVLKIKKAKEIIIKRLCDPPTVQLLSTEVGLPLQKLKEGFKELYGHPVFTFLLDYKMQLACQLLRKKNLNINQISLQLGYSTASHFIASFKKKYGVTPKKYLQN